MKVTHFNEGHGFSRHTVSGGEGFKTDGKEALDEGHGFSRAESALITRRL